MISEPAHLDAIAHKLLVVPDFDVKASLSNKSEQKLKLTLVGWLATYMRPLFEALYYSHVERYLFPEAHHEGYSSRYLRRVGVTSIVVCRFVCLSVHDSKSAHLAAIALRLQHG